MKVYNVAVVGFGYMGKTHSYACTSLPYYYENAPFRVNLYAVCARTLEKAEYAKQAFGFDVATDDFDSILRDEKVDVIDICTPNALHYEQIKKALLAGKHVYCDKPLAATYEQAKEICELARKCGLCTGMTFQNRTFPAVIRAKELIEEGRLGDIITFRAAFLHSSLLDENKPYSWRTSSLSEGGGVAMDLGSHIIDIVTHLCGRIRDVKSMTKNLYPTRRDADGNIRKIESDDAVFMVCALENGAVGTVEASKLATGVSDSLRFEIHGTKGALRFDLACPGVLGFFDATDSDSGFKDIECMQKYPEPCNFLNGKILPGWIRGHIHATYVYFDALHNGKKPSPDFEDGLEAQRIIELSRNC